MKHYKWNDLEIILNKIIFCLLIFYFLTVNLLCILDDEKRDFETIHFHKVIVRFLIIMSFILNCKIYINRTLFYKICQK